MNASINATRLAEAYAAFGIERVSSGDPIMGKIQDRVVWDLSRRIDRLMLLAESGTISLQGLCENRLLRGRLENFVSICVDVIKDQAGTNGPYAIFSRDIGLLDEIDLDRITVFSNLGKRCRQIVAVLQDIHKRTDGFKELHSSAQKTAIGPRQEEQAALLRRILNALHSDSTVHVKLMGMFPP